eukprot:SAG31_NODE_19734_length_593_cov_0.700405_1_plen_112_part_00
MIIFVAFLYAYIIGDFSNLQATVSKERNDFEEKMRTVNDLLSYVAAPQELRIKIQDFYDFSTIPLVPCHSSLNCHHALNHTSPTVIHRVPKQRRRGGGAVRSSGLPESVTG